MRPPKSLQWRIAAAYTALIILMTASVATLLVLLVFDGKTNVVKVAVNTGIVTAAGCITAITVASWLARSTGRSMRTAADAARRLADGDLEHRLEPVVSGRESGFHERLQSDGGGRCIERS